MKTLRIFLWGIFLKTICCSTLGEFESSNKAEVLSRDSRALAFPGSSTVGILLAVAIPLNLPNREVFLSYNFEANYNSPAAPDYAHLGLAGVEKYEYPEGNSRSTDGSNNTSISLPKKKKQKGKQTKRKGRPKKDSRKRRFIDRKIVFNVMENKLVSYGFSKDCLLRAICEVALVEYGYNNGIFGDIFHILFTPTSSQDDEIDLKYYVAEYNGNAGKCKMYETECPKSILDFFTVER
ncbi:hypothetical protein Bhyg_16363 [Pseudolycoriella hygida]|uniref:Uncharacterized protein n=1 Tax=Pseudolycoriella hygida TaxID=35572 RepID=A0A9Q0RU35_9DIPT|nr:hypothetical protein Bhyg_16363 [Pseudolycoriella hygida]